MMAIKTLIVIPWDTIKILSALSSRILFKALLTLYKGLHRIHPQLAYIGGAY